MEDQYIFTQLEYAKMLGISKECLRSRRRSGKLDGEFILKDNCYLYKRGRPNQHTTIVKNHTPRMRRRGVHKSGEPTRYTSSALQRKNELRMLLKLQRTVDKETLDLFPSALEQVRKMKEEARSKVNEPRAADSKQFKSYGSGIRNCKHSVPQYRPLNKVIKVKQFSYY